VEMIRSFPNEPYTLADLCRIGSLSARGLQLQFQQHYGVSPMQYLRQVRLDHARDALRAGGVSVSDAAYDAGFSNVGRFARAYRLRFGELPSATRAGG
jgi:transcriptional regulator GlxA family with amidase domain